MTAETISELLAGCDREGKTVSIAAGGTLCGMGLSAARTDETLSTLALDGIVEDAPSDLTIAVQSGVTLRALSHTLAPHGTHVPFDAPRAAEATVGGTLAAGWLGPRRHVYGRARDFLIGTTVVLADGTIARAGGMVVKNVSGYDMSRLYVGSFGTLCILVQANLKTIVLPPHARVFLARLLEGTRERAVAQMQMLAVAPSAAFWVRGYRGAIDGDDGAEGRMVILLEGSAELLERSTRDLRSALGRAGVPETRVIDAGAREAFERTVDAYVACVGERSITYRLRMPAEGAQRALDGLESLAARFELRVDAIIDAMNGDTVARISDLDAHALAAKIEMFDDALHDEQPAAMVIAGNHPARSRLQVWGELPPAFEQMRALKQRFDPNRTLNPGRFVGGI
ncbi:MAG: FAD-binding oxidoreductase [Candidatus Baltobacteraceae bacterium]